MKQRLYYNLLIGMLISTQITLFYAQKSTSESKIESKACQGSYELLEASGNAGSESPVSIVKLHDIVTYLKNVDATFTPQTTIKEIIIRFAHALLTELNIPLTNIPNEMVASELQQHMPEAYNFFMNILVLAHNPEEFFNSISAEYEIIKERLPTSVQKLIEKIIIFTSVTVKSDDSIDKNAIKALTKIADSFICTKFNDGCCQTPGIITILLTNSLHKDASGKDDGSIQLLNESIEQLVTEFDNSITIPSITSAFKAFFLKHAISIVNLEDLLKSITQEELDLLKPSAIEGLSALLSQTDNALALAKF